MPAMHQSQKIYSPTAHSRLKVSSSSNNHYCVLGLISITHLLRQFKFVLYMAVAVELHLRLLTQIYFCCSFEPFLKTFLASHILKYQ